MAPLEQRQAGGPPTATDAEARPEAERGGAGRPLAALRPTVLLQIVAGNMMLQARPLLAARCGGSGAEAGAAVRTQLATAQSLGSLAELLSGPRLGRLSDETGRKPVMLFNILAPAVAWVMVLLSGTRSAWGMRLLCLDAFLTRGFGMGPMLNTANVMISDAVCPSDQPQARADLASVRALGVVVGSLLGGWLQSRVGLAAPYATGVVAACSAAVNLARRQPETRCAVPVPRTPGHAALADGGAEGTAGARWRGLWAVRQLLADAEAGPLTLLLVVQQAALHPLFSDVAMMFFRDTLRWDPATSGRFLAAYGLSDFVGSRAAGPLVRVCGPDLQTSLSHLGIVLAFVAWGSARSSGAMAGVLLPLTVSFGRGAVAQSRALGRAEELGMGRGEAMAALSSAGGLVRIASPRLFAALYGASCPGPGGRPAPLPSGSPFFFVAIVGAACELLHRRALRARPRAAG